MPRIPNELPIVILKKKDQTNNIKNFIVNRNRVLICLKFLCDNNPLYITNGIKLDYNVIEQLPSNGLLSGLQEIIDPELADQNSFNEMEIYIDNGPEMVDLSFDNTEIEVKYNKN